MPDRFDIIGIGIGAMGSAACWHLARRGVRVLGLERFDVGHPHGSSGGDTRLVRLAYYEHPDYVPLLRRAYEHWDAIGEEADEKLLHRTGGLYIGDPARAFIAGSRASADQHGLAYDMLDADALAAQFPAFRMPPHFAAMHERDAGFVYSQRAIRAFARCAAERGAQMHANETVTRWSADGAGVTVETDRATYHAGHLILTAGPWTAALLPQLAPHLTVTRQVLGWVDPPRPDVFALGRFPCWGIEDDAPGFEGIYYGFPLLDPSDGLKLAHHAPGPQIDPNTVERRATDADADDFRPALAKYLPDADGPVRRMHVCMYTCSPDHHFLIDAHPEHANVTFAAGFSGHGFKFASVVGEVLADLAITGSTALPADFLRLSRPH